MIFFSDVFFLKIYKKIEFPKIIERRFLKYNFEFLFFILFLKYFPKSFFSKLFLKKLFGKYFFPHTFFVCEKKFYDS